MSVHTPGPWHAYDDEGEWLVCIGTIPGAFAIGSFFTYENALLGAAAPDLLAACEAFVAKDVIENRIGMRRARVAARAAITKATGGQS